MRLRVGGDGFLVRCRLAEDAGLIGLKEDEVEQIMLGCQSVGRANVPGWIGSPSGPAQWVGVRAGLGPPRPLGGAEWAT